MWGEWGTYPLSDGNYQATGVSLLGPDASAGTFFGQPSRTTNFIGTPYSTYVGVSEDYWNQPRQVTIAVRVKGSSGKDMRQRIFDLTTAALQPNASLRFGINLCQQPSPIGNVWPKMWTKVGSTWTASAGKLQGVGQSSVQECLYTLPVTGGTAYYVSVLNQITSWTSGTLTIFLAWTDANRNQLTTVPLRNVNTSTVDASWVVSEGAAVAPANAAYAQLVCWLAAGSNMTVYVWNWFFGLTPTTYTVLSCSGPTTTFDQTATKQHWSTVVFQPWIQPFSSTGSLGPF